MEEIINDEFGNVLTVKYDSNEDKVTFNNSGVDSIFHEVKKCHEEYGTTVICIDDMNNFDSESDVISRLKVADFFWANKKNP